MKKKLPIGIEDFEKLRQYDFYYVDKTGLMKELLQNWGEVNLFTRPRRFGKSLNMSMLKYFFEIGSDPALFEGLEISKEKQLCEEYMGKFPVISISLKGINAGCYETARAMAVKTINEEASRFQYLLDDECLTQDEKETFAMLLKRNMDDAALFGSLRDLSRLLQKHHGRKVVLLIDEYDVPLAKAFEQGYYDQMIVLIRNMFEQGLKTNGNLFMAVLTGCMRVSKESIFTGLNNLRVLSIADVRFDEYFGFTDKEVREMLAYYDKSLYYETVREWYDGYRFGAVDVYCPWDVINYCDLLRSNPKAQPQNYWCNTSSNDAVRRFIEMADVGATKMEIEKLVAGEKITKEIHQELTYQDMYSTIENLWSLLFTTGYLTQRGEPEGRQFHLAIPNKEIREIFEMQIVDLFKEHVKKDGETLDRFCEALKNGETESIQQQFQAYLRKTISIRDTFVKKNMKENFYHGILLGILGFKASWNVFSNRETGEGYSDLLITIPDEAIGIVIEMKYAGDGNLDAACKKALEQIEGNHYEEELYDEGMDDILKYGIACYKKRCRVMKK
ncbi:MAG: AAA family ATPase [Lachnospiraceae bacterium]|nr:AAA family ATPase [Lachnospiraceae bacterium]